MRMVEIKLRCGWEMPTVGQCPTVGLEGEGIVITRILNTTGKPVEVDICKEHSDELDELLAPLLADGRVLEDSKAPARKKGATKSPGAGKMQLSVEDRTCKIPDCNMTRPSKSAVGMAQHVIRSHGYPSLDAYFEEYPPSSRTG